MSETTTRWAWRAGVGAACGLAALVMTWPLALQLATTVPLGTEHEATVQVFSIWTLWWTADRLTHGLTGYWDAPFFYPNRSVFTYSEPEPLTGALVAPLWGLGIPPAAIHNVALLGLLMLNGLFAYRLARGLEIARLPATIAGLLTVTLPVIAKVYGVLNLVPVFGLLGTLDGLVRFRRSGATRDAAWVAGSSVAAYLTCQQYTLMFAPFAGLAGLLALWPHLRAPAPARRTAGRVAVPARQALLRLGGSALVAAAIIGVVAWPALTTHGDLGFRRSDELVQALSAQPGDFLTRPGTATLAVPPPDPHDTAGLFPGVLLLGLAVVGAGRGWRAPATRLWVGVLGTMVLGGGLLALGLNLSLGGWQPFTTLRALLPGLAELRSPFRYVVIMQIALPILAALGLAALAARVGRWGVAAILGLGLLAGLENLAIPAPLTAVPISPATAWTHWLRDQPAGTTVAHIPFPAGVHVSDYEIDAWRMYAQIDHHQPLANGYSSYFPPNYTQFQAAMTTQFPDDPALFCVLGLSLQINTLVVDQPWLVAHRAGIAAQDRFLQPVYSDNQVQIYHLLIPPGACQAQGPP